MKGQKEKERGMAEKNSKWLEKKNKGKERNKLVWLIRQVHRRNTLHKYQKLAEKEHLLEHYLLKLMVTFGIAMWRDATGSKTVVLLLPSLQTGLVSWQEEVTWY